MEASFSPPNLKRIGYPKNTIYMKQSKAPILCKKCEYYHMRNDECFEDKTLGDFCLSDKQIIPDKIWGVKKNYYWEKPYYIYLLICICSAIYST